MKTKRKMLPKKDAPKGLYLFCKKHNKWFKNDTTVTCSMKCALKYKAKIHIPGTKRSCRIKLLKAESVEEAILLFQNFKLKMKQNDFQKVELKPKVVKPIFLIDCIEEFLSYKRGENVPVHEKVVLTPNYLRNIELCCEYLTYALHDNNVDVKAFRFESFNSTSVGYVSTYLINKLKANKTYNSYMENIQAFAKYIYMKHYPELKNPFEKITKFKENTDKKSISKVEFLKLIDVVKPENAFGTEKRKERTVKINYYRPWLIDAYYLGVFAGGRNEEIVKMKWSDIKLNEEGQISLVEIIDYKRTRLDKNGGIENLPVIKTVEMTPEFESMLREMGYEDNINSNDYILAPSESMSRDTMKAFMSDAFTHYFSQLKLPVKKNFKHLRKTYVTNCYIQTPDTKAFLIRTGHANMETPLNHYVDMKIVMEARRKKLYEMKIREEEKGNDMSINS